MKNKLWLVFILITIVTWGVWGAFSGYQIQNGISDTVVYIIWALTMIPCAIVALCVNKGKFMHDWKSALLGCTVGLLGAGGQLVLFKALNYGPSYIIYPFIAMSPVIVITLAAIFLKEKTSKWQIAGILVALLAIGLFGVGEQLKPADENKEDAKEIVTAENEVATTTEIAMTDVQNKETVEAELVDTEDVTPVKEEKATKGFLWIVLAVLVLFAWGVQGFFMKFANNSMDAESIFVWMALSGLLLIPIAWFMDGSAAEFFGSFNASQFWATFGIQILNAVGALTLVYAYRYGKAVIVSPMEGLSPMVTVLLSLIILSAMPNPVQIAGLCCAAFAMYALSK